MTRPLPIGNDNDILNGYKSPLRKGASKNSQTDQREGSIPQAAVPPTCHLAPDSCIFPNRES